MNPLPEPAARPSLEALLRLKRSERPDSDFWMEFERGMKQKQLAAMVEPKPWWLELSLAVRRFSPLAGAGLAGGIALFAMISFRNDLTHVNGPSPSSAATVASSPHGPSAPVQESAVGRVSAAARDSEAELILASVEPNSWRGVTSNSMEVHHPADLVTELLESTALRVAEMIDTPGSADAAIAQAVSGTDKGGLDPMIIDKGFSAHLIESREFVSDGAMPISVATGGTDEASTLEFSTPRQARLLAVASDSLAASDPKSLAQVRDRVIHRMSEGESLYASISRLGVSGDRLSVKF